MFGELVNGIAAVEQYAGVAVNEGNFRLARSCRGEAWVEGEHLRLGIKMPDVENAGA